jgi:protein tyrosine/serine phosphatase
MNERVLPLEGIHNFRDYGGYALAGGGRLKSGILWRSGQHVDASSADLDRVHQLSLVTVIDLRGDSERASYPCTRHPEFGAAVLFAEGETVGGHAPHVEAAQAVETADQARAAMTQLYKLMPFRPNLITVFRLYLTALAQQQTPSLIHCLAGKDRTGLAVALVHHLTGVHQDDMMADYLLTNTAGNIERRIAAGATAVRDNFGHRMSDDAVRTLMSVDAAYLEAALASIVDTHGSVENYARDVLSVDAAMRDALQQHLIA